MLADSGCLIAISNDTILLWHYPPIIFSLFDRIYILIYLFDTSILKYYFDLHQIKYEKKSIYQESGAYVFGDYFVPDTRKHADLINVYEGKLNMKQKRTNLSSSWFNHLSNNDRIDQLRRNLYNYLRYFLNVSSDTIMWTTFKSGYTKLRGKGFSKKFEAKELIA